MYNKKRKEGNEMNVERLKKMRKERGLTQGKLAQQIGIARTTYANYEQGLRDVDNKTLNKLADFFDVSTDYLLGRDIPQWATRKDILDLEDVLHTNVHMAYGGEDLTEEDKKRVEEVLKLVFWERLEKKGSNE